MIGAAQIVLPHKQMVTAGDLGASVRALFDHVDRVLDIEKVSVGVCPPRSHGEPITGTWFRFQGELR